MNKNKESSDLFVSESFAHKAVQRFFRHRLAVIGLVILIITTLYTLLAERKGVFVKGIRKKSSKASALKMKATADSHNPPNQSLACVPGEADNS